MFSCAASCFSAGSTRPVDYWNERESQRTHYSVSPPTPPASSTISVYVSLHSPSRPYQPRTSRHPQRRPVSRRAAATLRLPNTRNRDARRDYASRACLSARRLQRRAKGPFNPRHRVSHQFGTMCSNGRFGSRYTLRHRLLRGRHRSFEHVKQGRSGIWSHAALSDEVVRQDLFCRRQVFGSAARLGLNGSIARCGPCARVVTKVRCRQCDLKFFCFGQRVHKVGQRGIGPSQSFRRSAEFSDRRCIRCSHCQYGSTRRIGEQDRPWLEHDRRSFTQIPRSFMALRRV